MTVQEAIKEFDNYGLTGDYSKKETPELYEAVQVAREALEKQIPKKPIEIEVPSEHKLQCPTCYNRYFFKNSIFNKDYNYCDNCGQALDWSEEE